MEVNLQYSTQNTRLQNGDEVVIYFNPAGQEGYLVDCFIGFDANGNQLTWELNGSSMHGNEYDIAETFV
jgi:hypothetical protein